MNSRRYLFFVEQPYAFAIIRPIQRVIIQQGGTIKWFLFEQDECQLHEGEDLLRNTREVVEFNPEAVIVPGNWVPNFFPGLKVQVFHGFGIDKKGHFKIRDFFDLYCTHGPLTTSWFENEAKRRKYFRVIETGWSKMDEMAQLVDERTELSQPYELLYAPTFSPSLTSAMDLRASFEELSQSGLYKIRVKFHPMMNEQWVKAYEAIENENLTINREPNFLDSVKGADIVISDTSSVVAEALCIGKVVLTYRTLRPSNYCLNFTEASEIVSIVAQSVVDYAELKAMGEDYAQKMHPYKDGLSSNRILEAIEYMIKDGECEKRKPLNFVRNRKVKKKMKAYR